MSWTVHLEGGPCHANHAAVVVGKFIYSFGGYRSGRNYRLFHNIDVHVLYTEPLQWFLVHPLKSELFLQYPDVPFKRYGHTVIVYNKKVYMWGGRNDEIYCNILFCFDTGTHKWSRPDVNGVIPCARDGHSACIIDNNMYIFGGFNEEINQFTYQLHCLNLETMTWRYILTTGTAPNQRDFQTANVLNDCIYVFGGRGYRYSPLHNQEIYCPQIMYLDLRTRVWHKPHTTGTVPVGRRSHSAIVYNGNLYVFGGYNGILDQHFNDLYCFDPVQNKWSLLIPKGCPPIPRRRHVCLVKDKKMYLFGGAR